jgi:hypothetical protein
MDVAEIVFEKNPKDINILLTMHGLENVYELFRFCVSLCIRGLVMLCGNHVEIDSITGENIAIVQKKMYNAGIDMTISIEPKMVELPSVEVRTRPPTTALNDFALFIHSRQYTYVLTFTLIRQQYIEKCHHE